ncbi:hypothetical protein B0J12DRAFT_681154 [Macrophomina phaseolina]|uniref:BTB domain-containing protein n=1 Tax=Macrophomina phaseolina TaxID=35725 RepID=A0ABQ8FWS2_9PEZI|nr:hypothetical protein B0J12DRAFT_681154 [Macrophomina phaseolina]
MFSLPSKLFKAMKTGHLSDLTIRLRDGQELKVHRLVVSSGSEFFANAIKNGDFMEGRTGTINLQDDPPEAVACMIEYLYTGAYSVGKQRQGVASEDDDEKDGINKMSTMLEGELAATLVGHAHVYAVAHLYLVEGLQQLAADNVKLAFGEDAAIHALPDVVAIILSSVPASTCTLRSDLVRFASKKLATLASGPGLLLQRLFDAAPEFGARVVGLVAKERDGLALRLDRSKRRYEKLKEEAKGSERARRTYVCTCRHEFERPPLAAQDRFACPECGSSRKGSWWAARAVGSKRRCVG